MHHHHVCESPDDDSLCVTRHGLYATSVYERSAWSRESLDDTSEATGKPLYSHYNFYKNSMDKSCRDGSDTNTHDRPNSEGYYGRFHRQDPLYASPLSRAHNADGTSCRKTKTKIAVITRKIRCTCTHQETILMPRKTLKPIWAIRTAGWHTPHCSLATFSI